ncbi:MAG: hypothetical protein ACFFCK_00030 [Promethearchaeota archaeon]
MCSNNRFVELAPSFLYIYDCKRARQTNARRVSFTKELHGYVYSWKTKSGIRQKKKPGLIDQCEGAEAVADSAILVPSAFKSLFDQLFSSYTDILVHHVYEVLGEVDNH